MLYLTSDGKSKNTIELYRVYLTRMIEYLNDPDIHSIQPEDIQRFYAYMQTDYHPHRKGKKKNADPLSKSTINRIWVAIRSFYNWAEVKLGVTRADTDINLVDDLQDEIIPFSQDEIKKLLACCEKTWCKGSEHQPEHYQRRRTRVRDYAMILFLLDTGVRVSEMCRLTVGEVKLSDGEVKIRKWGSGKKTRGRTVYIENKAREALWSYLATRNAKPDDPLFENRDRDFMDRNAVRCLFEDMAKRAGIDKANPHRFRHTFAIQYLRNGGDVFTLQRLLGHTSLKMVRTYLAIADVDSANAHRRASPVDCWRL